jgi:tetratricopeptide (TPR) repeat protein
LEAYIEAFGHTPEYISDEGFEEMQRALMSDLKMKELWKNLGTNYRVRGEVSKAIETYEKGIKINPNFTLNKKRRIFKKNCYISWF